MPNNLPRLHDPHNRRLALKIPILRDADVSFFVLFFGFFQLHLVDLDAVFGVLEQAVDCEGVGGGDIAAAGVFGEGPEFGAGEGLEGAGYFLFGWGEVSTEQRSQI